MYISAIPHSILSEPSKDTSQTMQLQINFQLVQDGGLACDKKIAHGNFEKINLFLTLLLQI